MLALSSQPSVGASADRSSWRRFTLWFWLLALYPLLVNLGLIANGMAVGFPLYWFTSVLPTGLLLLLLDYVGLAVLLGRAAFRYAPSLRFLKASLFVLTALSVIELDGWANTSLTTQPAAMRLHAAVAVLGTLVLNVVPRLLVLLPAYALLYYWFLRRSDIEDRKDSLPQ